LDSEQERLDSEQWLEGEQESLDSKQQELYQKICQETIRKIRERI
jgi:hypothetical protein